jgi:hypothetical protein
MEQAFSWWPPGLTNARRAARSPPVDFRQKWTPQSACPYVPTLPINNDRRRKMRKSALVGAVGAFVLSTAAANATLIFQASLSGGAQVPPFNSTATAQRR